MRSTLAVLAVLMAVPSTAYAQAAAPAGEFGRGQFIVSADRLLGLFSYASRTDTRANGNQTIETTTSGPGISLFHGGNRAVDVVHNTPRLSLDYALPMGLTLGGSVPLVFGLGGSQKTKVNGVDQPQRDAPTESIIGFVPRVGYILNLSDMFAFWPRGGFAYYRGSSSNKFVEQGVEVTDTTSRSFISIDIDPQFVILPVPHVGITLGALLNIPLGGSIESKRQAGPTTTTVETDSTVFHLGFNAGLLAYF